MIWIWVCFILLLAYVLLILSYWYGYSRIPYTNKLLEPKIHFSIIISVRNEEENIAACIESITNQNYPKDFYEIIIVDDNSDDKTLHIINNYKNSIKNLRIIEASSFGKKGKKSAITLGIEHAVFDFCLLTDADCITHKNRLLSLNSFIQKNQTVFIYAPVTFTEKNIFEKIQCLEFAGLVGIGGAAIQLKNPNICSGANLVISKKAFIEVEGYKDNLHLEAGDDELLLQKIFKHYPNQVYFLKCYDALVTTGANNTLKQLTDQRRRWVSNSTKYENIYITLILVGAYIFNFSIAFNIIYGISNHTFLITGFIQLLLKTIVEGLFLYDILRLLRKTYLIKYLFLAEPLHILYVIVIGIWANINAYQWKGRNHN